MNPHQFNQQEKINVLEDKVKNLDFRITTIETSKRDLLRQIELLKNDKDILVECLQKAQVKIGKDTRPNFIDLALALVKR